MAEFVWVTFIPEKILFVSANKVDLHLLRNVSQRYLCIPSESEIWLWSTVKTLGSFASVFSLPGKYTHFLPLNVFEIMISVFLVRVDDAKQTVPITK